MLQLWPRGDVPAVLTALAALGFAPAYSSVLKADTKPRSAASIVRALVCR